MHCAHAHHIGGKRYEELVKESARKTLDVWTDERLKAAKPKEKRPHRS